MSKTAFIFAGQGAQKVGMGKEICENFACAEQIFDEASSALGFDVKEMVFHGDDETLMITENTQPTILTVSIAILKALQEKGIQPDVVAGLSLGEYSAHVAAGTMSFRDAVRAVKKRGKFMQEEVPVGVGAMAAIIALPNEKVYDACMQAQPEGLVTPANLNCPGQVVVSGEKKAVEKACEIAKEMGAKRAMLLPVSAPFHCLLLKGAGEKLKPVLSEITFQDFKLPLVTNVTGRYVERKSDILDLLIRQVSSPVLWEDSVRFMISEGVDTFVEVGPGKALSGFVKKISKDVKVLNVEDMATLEKTIEELGV